MGIKKINLGGGGGGSVWGDITGTLAAQTDLVAILNTKANSTYVDNQLSFKANITDLPLTKNTPTTSQVITSGYSSIICNIYEISNTLTLEIQNNAILEIS